jgi:hypothetical protein
MLPIFNMGVIAGAGVPNLSLLAAIQGLGLTANLKLCLDAGDRDSYAGGSLTTTAGPSTLTSNPAAWNSFTMRQVIAAAQVSASGSQVVVTFGGDGSGTFTITKAYIGHQGAGDAYDFDTTPVQLTFGGNAGFTVTDAQEISSDPATFALDETQNLVISFYVPSSAGDDFGTQTTLTGWSSYFKSGDDAATVNATGYTAYTATRNVVGVKQVDVVATGDGGQVWADRSGENTDFVRGAVGIVDSADPTFNGAVGGLSGNDYWSLDGGDYFSPATQATPSWVQAFHKNGAAFTIMTGVYPTGTSGVICSDSRLNATSIGFTFRFTGSALYLGVFEGAGFNIDAAAATLNVDAWNIAGVSVNENGGATAGVFLTNGTTETFNPAYSSPSASDADYLFRICALGDLTAFLGGRMGWIAIWDTALTAANMQLLYALMRGRFNI